MEMSFGFCIFLINSLAQKQMRVIYMEHVFSGLLIDKKFARIRN